MNQLKQTSSHVKNLRFILLLAVALMAMAAGLSACNSNDDTPDPSAKLYFSPSSMLFDASGSQTQMLNVVCTSRFLVRSSASWCEVKQSGMTTEMEDNYAVKCEPNTGVDSRSCTVKIYVGDTEKGAVTITQAGVSTTPDTPVEMKPANTASPLGLGWNLGNQMDAHANGVASETCWGNKAATQQTMDAVKAAGFTSVRIPVTWMGHIGQAPDYTIEAAWLDRVAEIVGYAEKAGLKAIVNIHHDGGDSQYWLDIKNAALDPEVNTRVKAQLAALWSQIADKFADKGDFLYFESMNEIHDGGWGWGANRTDGGRQYKVFNEWQQTFVDAVRARGGGNADRWLCIPTYCTNIDLGDNLQLPADPASRLIVAVHCYEPYEYTLEDKYSEWGHTGAAGKKPSSSESNLVAELDKVVAKWLDKGVGAYIGEFGCVRRSADRAEAFRKYYLEYFTKAAADRNIPVIYWDNGATGSGREAGGLIDHSTGAFINNGADITGVMTRGYFSTTPGYSLTSVYDSAPM